MVLGELERTAAAKIHKDLFHRETSAAQYEGGGKVFTHHFDAARTQFNKVRQLDMPYVKFTEPSSTDEVTELINMFEEIVKIKEEEANA